MKLKKQKKRHKLGEGYIWFNGAGPDGVGYTHVTLARSPGGFPRKVLKTGKLGGWIKVKLYAEYIE